MQVNEECGERCDVPLRVQMWWRAGQHSGVTGEWYEDVICPKSGLGQCIIFETERDCESSENLA